VCVCVCVRAHACACVYVCVRVYMYLNMYVGTCVDARMSKHVCMRMRACPQAGYA
jgi:hypothetical protein